MSLGLTMSLRQVQLMTLPQIHLMCMIPLFELNLVGLRHLQDYIERLTPDEVEALGSVAIRGNGKKAFHDVKLETLLGESGASDISKDPDVSLRLNYGELNFDYSTDRIGDGFFPADPENEDSLIRNSKYILRNLRWVDGAMREVYNIVLNHQKEYLLTNNPEKLKPLTQEGIAEQMGISGTTVSRLMKGKTVRSLDGHIMPLNSLVLQQDEINRLRAYEVLATEIKNGTYTTDEEAVKLVYERTGAENNGILLARRTIAKYRQEIEEQMCKDIHGLAVYCLNAALRDKTKLS